MASRSSRSASTLSRSSGGSGALGAAWSSAPSSEPSSRGSSFCIACRLREPLLFLFLVLVPLLETERAKRLGIFQPSRGTAFLGAAADPLVHGPVVDLA